MFATDSLTIESISEIAFQRILLREQSIHAIRAFEIKKKKKIIIIIAQRRLIYRIVELIYYKNKTR